MDRYGDTLKRLALTSINIKDRKSKPKVLKKYSKKMLRKMLDGELIELAKTTEYGDDIFKDDVAFAWFSLKIFYLRNRGLKK